LYADENIAIPTVTYLKSKGVSIVHAYSIGFINKKDELHFKKSKSLNRILLSLDKDFRKFKGALMDDHPGIILVTSGSSTFEHINEILDKGLKKISSDYVRRSIIRVTMDKIVKEKDGKVVNEKKL
jgi:predicted nuclease of predicted toxin-antitoxin system